MSHLSLPINIEFVKLVYHGSSWLLPCKTVEILQSRCLVYKPLCFLFREQHSMDGDHIRFPLDMLAHA